MRRPLLGFCLCGMCLACGALLTVAVAWGCLLWSPAVEARPTPQFMHGGHPITRAMSRYGEFDGYTVFEHRGAGWTLDHVLASYKKYHHSSPRNRNEMTRVSAGWPWLCLEGERRVIAAQPSAWRITSVPTLPGADATRRTYIPFSPRWPAFLTSIAMYAAMTFTVVAIAIIGKRLYRHWRGRCPGCGYHLRGLSPADCRIRCPECGKSVRQSVPIT